jgi:hypothetical protein
VIECVTREIAQDAVEQHGLAHDRGARRQKPEIDPLAPRGSLELSREALENRLEPNRLRFYPAGALVQLQRVDQLVQLFLQLGARLLAAFQVLALGSGGQPPGEQLVRADNGLQWLAQIVARHGENRSVKIDSPQKIPSVRFALAIGPPLVAANFAYADAALRAKRGGHRSLRHDPPPRSRGCSSLGAIPTRGRD